MSIGSITAVAIVMVAFFIFAQIWFHSIEAILTVLNHLFRKKAKTTEWHPLSENKDDQVG